MLRSRLFWKLYIGYAVFIILSTATVGALVARQVEQNTLEEIKHSLNIRAFLLKDIALESLAKYPLPPFQKRIRNIGKETKTRFTVIKDDGTVISDSEKNPSLMDNHASRPEIITARSYGVGISTRFSQTLQKKMMYLAISVRGGGKFLGYVRTSLPLTAIEKSLYQLKATVAFGAGVGLIVALPLGFLFSQYFTRPLSSMAVMASSMSHGNYQQRIPSMRRDEIGELARALNLLAKKSQNRLDIITTDRNKLLVILAGMVEGVIAVDQGERVIHMNDTASKILGVLPAESLNKTIWEVTRTRKVCEILGRALQSNTNIKESLRFDVKSKLSVIDMYASPLHDSEGKLVGAVVVMHDVSDLHRLEEIRQDFVANASHELKTPVTVIRGMVETLIDDSNMPAKSQERFLDKIQKQSIRLALIINDLLALSRLEAVGSVFDHKTFDLCNVIMSTTQVLLPVSEEKNIALVAELPSLPVKIVGDKSAISQLTSNLLDNAFKYTPRGGSVWVRLRSDGQNAIIEVQDTGIGIEISHQNRIFERFYRVDKARSRELGGTGLGLSIVKHIALAHNGRVSLDSTIGIGSTFRVCIPLITT